MHKGKYEHYPIKMNKLLRDPHINKYYHVKIKKKTAVLHLQPPRS